MNLPTEQFATLFTFFVDEQNTQPMEDWVYSTIELESYLGPDDYLELISLDFREPSVRYSAEKIFRKHIDANSFVIWRIRALMERIITRADNVHYDILETYRLYCHGYEFLQKLGIDFGLKLAAPQSGQAYEWDDLSDEDQSELVDQLYPKIIEHAKWVLHCFDESKIEFTFIEMDSLFEPLPFQPTYIDRRAPKEKKLMSVEAIVVSGP